MSIWEDKRYIYSDSSPSAAGTLKSRIAKDHKQPDSMLRPKISFCYEAGAINIGKDVIRILKYPNYIVLMQSEQQRAVAVVPGDPEDHNAFRVPRGFPEERHSIFRITSKSYVEEMLALHWSGGSDRGKGKLVGPKERTLEFLGRYDANCNAVIFEL